VGFAYCFKNSRGKFSRHYWSTAAKSSLASNCSNWLALLQPGKGPGTFGMVVSDLRMRTMTRLTDRVSFGTSTEQPFGSVGRNVWWTSSGDLYFVEGPPAQIVRARPARSLENPQTIVSAADASDELRDIFVSDDEHLLRYVRALKGGIYETRARDLTSGSDEAVFVDRLGPEGYFFVAGYSPDGTRAVVLRATALKPDGSQAIEVLEISGAGVVRHVTSVDTGVGATARLAQRSDPGRNVLYVTISHKGIRGSE
jgi:hypothetical protein